MNICSELRKICEYFLNFISVENTRKSKNDKKITNQDIIIYNKGGGN